MRLLLALFVAVAVSAVTGRMSRVSRSQRDMVGSNLTTTELIEAVGYTAEIHHVVTEDGYILELHRIPYGLAGDTGEVRPVAFLQHCLLCSSADFVLNSPDKALAYLLAEAGYDVWMGNFRGNTYSKNHTTLDPEGREFWQFTFDQMGQYDIPAFIDYTLAVTGQESLYFVGFSMGTTSFLAMMSEMPEYGSKIKVAALMAPAVHMETMKGLLGELAIYSDQVDNILSLLGYHEFAPSSAFVDHFVNEYCNKDAPTAGICYDFLYLISGPSEGELNEEYLPVILSHTPAGTSTHTINHYGQLKVSQTFQKYDWGKLGNLAHYGQATPPAYDLTNITLPIGLFWSDSDWLATPENVVTLTTELKNVVMNHEVEKELFNHLDFVWALNVDTLVNQYVMELLSQY